MDQRQHSDLQLPSRQEEPEDTRAKGTAERIPFSAAIQRVLSAPTATPEQERAWDHWYRDEEDRRSRKGKYAWTGVVNQRYRDCSLDNFRCRNKFQQAVIDGLREYATDIPTRYKLGEGLVLFGTVGTGKDHLATAMLRTACDVGLTVGWINGQDWFGRLRDRMDTGEQEADEMRRLTLPQVLLVSDPLPPVGSLTQYQVTMLYRLVDERYNASKLTFTTLNVGDDEEADKAIGATTWDRLCHGAWKIHCSWASYRQPARRIGGKET